MSMTVPRTDLLPPFSLLIGDERAQGSGDRYEHVFAATGKVTGMLHTASTSDVDRAVMTARAAFPAWRKMPVNERRDLLIRIAGLVEEHTEELVYLNVLDNGTAISLVQLMPGSAAQQFRYYAGWADKIIGETIPTWHGPAHNYATLNPYGVIGLISPWNGPIYAIAQTLAPALAAGNCVVVKPSEIAPFATLRFAEIMLEAGLPPGVVNIVPGGAEAGEALVAHRGVDKIQFVGSGAVAEKVLMAAARTLKPCALELGGKSGRIVFEDARLDDAAFRSLSGAFLTSGQGCVNGTRILVQRSIHDDFVARMADKARALAIGDPHDPVNVMGPVISQKSADRILGMVSHAVEKDGARLVTGGARLGGVLKDGYFIPLTILSGVDRRSMLAQNEVFGPVLGVIPFDTEEEAIAISNETDFGLGGYIHTENVRRVHRVADAIDAGMIMVNATAEGMSPGSPFGGYKHSGYGRLGGGAGLREFLQTKNVWINIAD